jgi:lipopolysaccharide/colanic/teichoic acid biosynthesis glycosyltransferase
LPKDRAWRLLLAGLVLGDSICVVTAFFVAAAVSVRPPVTDPASQHYLLLIAVMVPIFLVMFSTLGLYSPFHLLGGSGEYARVLRACAYGIVLLVLISFAVHHQVSRQWTVLSCVLASTLVGLERFLVRRLAYRFRRRGYFTSRAIVVGADAQAVAVAEQLSRPGSGIEVLGVLDDYAAPGSVVGGRLKVLGTPAALTQVAARIGADEAIIVAQALPWETLQELLAKAASASNGLRVHLSAGYYDLLTTGVHLSQRNNVPLLTIEEVALTPPEAVFKRTFDCLLAGILLLLLSPAIALRLLQVRARGKEQMLERQPVLDRNGNAFELLSFGSSLGVKSDLFRKSPGLINVLAGQLSVVGPKPVPAGGPESSRPRAVRVRPGLTGLWRQVDDPTEQEVLDLYYVRSYSVWVDLHVLFTRLKARLVWPWPRGRRSFRARSTY